jgi:hypothetical protein
MTIRITLATLALLSQTGCVAAIPLAAQLVTGANTTSQLCSVAKIPGESTSLCDRFASAMQTPANAPTGATVTAQSH